MIKQKYYCIKCGEKLGVIEEKIPSIKNTRYIWSETNEMICKCGYKGSEYKLKNSLFDTTLTKTNGTLCDFKNINFEYGIPIRLTRVEKDIYVEGLKDHPQWSMIKEVE